MNEEAVLGPRPVGGHCGRLDRRHGPPAKGQNEVAAPPARGAGRHRCPDRHAAAAHRALGRPIAIPGIDDDHPAELALEDGDVKPVVLRGGTLPGIRRPGYHRLRFADREITLAVAPPRCVTLRDIGAGERMWGVAAQVYSLRRAGDGGIGDAGAVRDLAEAAAKHGADAVALSPVAQPVPARSGALRTLLAVEPAVPQSALRRSGGDLRCRRRRRR